MEIWKDIKGYEGMYQVSDLGNVRTLEHYCYSKKGSYLRIPSKLKKCAISKTGYYVASFSKDNNLKVIKIHRLIAESFIKNPLNKPCINHIDGNKLNNSLDNLEWCTHKENMEHAKSMGFMKNKYKGTGKSIDMYTMRDEYITTFNSFIDVYNFLGVKPDGVIYKIFSGERKSMHGYKFKISIKADT